MSSLRTTQLFALLLGATIAPVLVVSSYLYYLRTHPPVNYIFSDYGALVAAVFIGAIFAYCCGYLRGVVPA
jgi:hypothetical protein